MISFSNEKKISKIFNINYNNLTNNNSNNQKERERERFERKKWEEILKIDKSIWKSIR